MGNHSSSRQIIGPIDTEIIMNHYKAFTNPELAPPNVESQEEEHEGRPVGIMSSDYQLSMKQLTDDEKTARELDEEKRSRSVECKKYVPFFFKRELYFEVHEMEEESAFKDAAKPSPSLTSLNRELSTVSFTYAQMVAIVGPANVHRLLSQGKIKSALSNTSPEKDFTQEERNQLRTALEMLSNVDAKTLQQQSRRVAAWPSRERDKGDKSKKLSESTEPSNLLQGANHGEIVNLGAALPDEIMMQAAKGNEKLEPFEEGSKEIQGAADLCIRPSKIAAMQSDTELNIKYKALRSGSQELAQSKDTSSEGHESHESPNSTGGQRHAAGNSTSIRSFDEKNEFAMPSSWEPFEDNDSFADDLFPETNSSLVTADNLSIHYPTAVTCSFSTDSFKLCQKSVDTVSDSWWSDEDIAPSWNSISTATLPSGCSAAPSSLFPAKGFSPDEVVTSMQYTDDLDKAETAEPDTEATNSIFNTVLNAKSEQLNHVWGSEKGTSVTSDLVTAVSCLEDWKYSLPESHPPSFGVDDIPTAIPHTTVEAMP